MKMVAGVPNDMQLSKGVIHEARIEAGETVAGIIWSACRATMHPM
jgi:hypothetical protein